MNTNLTDITVVIDRSGSMESCRKEAEGGLNSFIKTQSDEPGEATFTLVQFDTEYDFVHVGVNIADVPKFKLVPRGGTALYDAVGRAVIETGQRLASIPEANRPGLVLFAILTDGEENSSKEFTGQQVKKMIEHQKKKYNWQFTFLGANQDAFKAAGDIGIGVAQTMNYEAANTDAAMSGLSLNTTRMRRASSKGKAVENSFTEEERASAVRGG